MGVMMGSPTIIAPWQCGQVTAELTIRASVGVLAPRWGHRPEASPEGLPQGSGVIQAEVLWSRWLGGGVVGRFR